MVQRLHRGKWLEGDVHGLSAAAIRQKVEGVGQRKIKRLPTSRANSREGVGLRSLQRVQRCLAIWSKTQQQRGKGPMILMDLVSHLPMCEKLDRLEFESNMGPSAVKFIAQTANSSRYGCSDLLRLNSCKQCPYLIGRADTECKKIQMNNLEIRRAITL